MIKKRMIYECVCDFCQYTEEVEKYSIPNEWVKRHDPENDKEYHFCPDCQKTLDVFMRLKEK